MAAEGPVDALANGRSKLAVPLELCLKAVLGSCHDHCYDHLQERVIQISDARTRRAPFAQSSPRNSYLYALPRTAVSIAYRE